MWYIGFVFNKNCHLNFVVKMWCPNTIYLNAQLKSYHIIIFKKNDKIDHFIYNYYRNKYLSIIAIIL